jgi:Lipocalin-like domain
VYGVKAHSLPDLAGTWRLVSYEARASSGEIRYPLGRHVVGQLFYDVRGNMSAHVIRVDRPTFASNDSGSGTDVEVRAAFEGHVSYFGTYTIGPSARTVTHHVRGASYPNWMGHDQIRYYRIDGSHRVLSTPPILDRGESLEYTLTWERI